MLPLAGSLEPLAAGPYGAFLLAEPDRTVELVKAATALQRLPSTSWEGMPAEKCSHGMAVGNPGRRCCWGTVTCKMRLCESMAATVALAKRLELAGIAMLTVEGRNVTQRNELRGISNWDAIRAVRSVGFPTTARCWPPYRRQ
jgi:hypothetical protein